MDLHEFKLNQYELEAGKFGRIFTFVDFGNVNYWYEKDRRDFEGRELKKDQKLIVDIDKLASFVHLFSEQARFYYGLDQYRSASIHIIHKARNHFIAITKPIQWVRHYIAEGEFIKDVSKIGEDIGGKFIRIPKCNFDVEICIDAIRLLNKYDTFCLFSGDSDFANLAKFLKQRSKRVILFCAGHIDHRLKQEANHIVSAQEIKSEIANFKTPRFSGRGLDIGSASGGQGSF